MTGSHKYKLNRTKYNRILSIIQEACVYTEDERAGHYVELMPWQKKMIRQLCMEDKNGKRQYRVVWLELPRKNGKSFMISLLAIVGMLTEKNPQVICAAATRDQARILFQYARDQIALSSRLRKYLKAFQHSIRMKNPKVPGTMRTISSDAPSAHGLNPSLILADEIHAWDERNGPLLWEALRTSMGARDSLMVAITTAGASYSFAWKMSQYARKVRDGEINDPHFLPIIYGVEDTDDIWSVKNWRKANPSLGVAITKEYLQDISNQAKHDEQAAISFKKLHLNQWAGSLSPYIDADKWRGCKWNRPADLKNWYCYLGVDLASVNDFTAYALVWHDGENRFYTEQHYQITSHALNKRKREYPHLVRQWIKAGLVEVIEGDANTSDDRIRMINKLVEEHSPHQLFFDPWNANETVKKLEDIYGKNYIYAVSQSIKFMSEPMKQLYKMVNTGHVGHDSNQITSWMVGNVELIIDPNENWKFDKSKSTDKIDGVAAILTAMAGYIHKDDCISIYDDQPITYV